MNGIPYVSIIIPVYDAEAYIAGCINSVRGLNFTDWELILVDDGSRDRSAEICRHFASEDGRIRVLTQQNSGASSARNTGLACARGEWISFIDADDWVDVDFLDDLENAEFCGRDVIFFGLKEYRGGDVAVKAICGEGYTVNGDVVDDVLKGLFLSKEHFFGYTVNKFYRRDIVRNNSLKFDESLIIKEDEEFMVRYCRYIRSVAVSSRTPYNYRILTGSTSHGGARRENKTGLGRAIEGDLEDYPWREFAAVMRRRLFDYFRDGAMESRGDKEFEMNRRVWVDYYDRNRGGLHLSGFMKTAMNFPDSLRNRVLTPGGLRWIKKNRTPLVAVKRALYPAKVLASSMLRRGRVRALVPKGEGLRMGDNISVKGRGKLRIGDGVYIDDNCSFCFNPIGGNEPEIELGNGVCLGKHNDFGCSEKIEIEDYVITAPYVHITDRNHCYEDAGVPVMHQATSVKGPVRVGRGSWLGFGVQIMSGVSIGRQCVVAAGSVVTKDVPDYCVAGGNPARVLKRYNVYNGEWERVR